MNLEYLRNVILQFLENKEMRVSVIGRVFFRADDPLVSVRFGALQPHLVRVLSIILHFTPQETRRLIAKV